MKRVRAIGVGFAALALLCVPEACQQFAPLQGDPDATVPGDAPRQSIEAGFDAQPPPFHPSFADDAGPGDILATILDECPAPPLAHGALSGDYELAKVCLSKTDFIAPVDQYCPGVSVVGDHASMRASGGLQSHGDGTVSRVGFQWIAAELEAPCRTKYGSGGCSALAGLVAAALGSKIPGLKLACYDQDEQTCLCQMESIGSLSDGKALPVDDDAGVIGKDYLYGTSAKGELTYRRSTTSNTLEQGFFWTLTQ